MTEEISDKNDELKFGYYLVVFLDIMGQRDAIRKLQVPEIINEESTKIIHEQLKNTVGKVATVRKLIHQAIDVVCKPTGNRFSFPSNVQNKLEKEAKPTIKLMRFSDTTVIFMPLGGSSMLNASINTYRVLSAAALVLLVCFKDGLALRGGIEIGASINLNKSPYSSEEIYGAALEQAYTLESKLAGYPRVIVGNGLLKFLSLTEDDLDTTEDKKLVKYMNDSTKELLLRDNDGLLVLNYLSNHILKLFKSPNTQAPKELFRNGLAFAEREHERFLDKGNLKLASRYGRLCSFFRDHEELWESS